MVYLNCYNCRKAFSITLEYTLNRMKALEMNADPKLLMSNHLSIKPFLQAGIYN